MTETNLESIGRVRRWCTFAGVAGAVTSMAANMLASDGTPVGLTVGVIAPGAFILASEIAAAASNLPRIRGTGVLLAILIGLLVLIGGSAAVVSFGHLREVVHRVGESPLAEVLIAIVVDSVAVMGLIGHRLTSLYLRRHHAAGAAKRQADRLAAEEARRTAQREAVEEADRERRRAERAATRTQREARAATGADPSSNGSAPVVGDDPSLPAPDRARVLKAANPKMTQAEIGQAIGRKERSVRRYLGDQADSTTEAEAEDTDALKHNGTGHDEHEGREAGLVAV